MKSILSSLRPVGGVFFVLAWAASAGAEIYTGNNAPGASSSFVIEVDSGTTNLSFIVPGNAASFSHLLVKKGSAPLDTSYDYSAQADKQTNAVHLELPEAAPGTYYVRVRTPLTSQTHDFILRVDRNSADLRSANRPASKYVTSLVTGLGGNGNREFFRVELTAGTAWQIHLSTATNADTAPDLYVQKGQVPSETVFWKASVTNNYDFLGFTAAEAPAGAYYIGVISTINSMARPYTVQLDTNQAAMLAWDPGVTHEGTQVYTNLSGRGGDYYFQITTGNPSLGAWRTALRVLSGEANLYLRRGVWPTVSTNDFKSERNGSDGVLLSSAGQFTANEVWYVLVHALEGAQWTLVSGSPYVLDLGIIAANGASSSGPVEVGPEGMRFFKAVANADMLAWRLWLRSTNYVTNMLYIKKAGVPLAIQNGSEFSRQGQALLVPPYLSVGQQYFIGVQGAPGQTLDLDCRQQPILDLAYDASFTTNVTGYGYLTFRVRIPTDQVAWQLTLPSTNGNPNLAVRKQQVPNESLNDAFSELSRTVPDNLALVPPGLSGDTYYYVTVYSSTNKFQFTLVSGPAIVTDIQYVSTTLNTDTNRIGWRFFRVSNLDPAQQRTLGWDLALSNFAPGTLIALRRNAAPGIWSFMGPGQAKYYDFLSTAEYLQEPGHQQDTWYIGVYNPSNQLGKFTLTTKELEFQPLADQAPLVRSNVLGGRWEFFSMVVPNDPNILGWDLRVTNVLAGQPQIVIARGVLPKDTLNTFSAPTQPWPVGGAWAPKADWTGRTTSADGSTDEQGRVVAMGMGRPLAPDTYYIGVLNRTNVPAIYTLVSRWIGPTQAIPVKDLAFRGGMVTNTLPPREAAYYRVVVPAGEPSWKIRLTPQDGGEAMMIVTTNLLPNIETTIKRMAKPGNEHYLRLPDKDASILAPGVNYVTVISEGQFPPADRTIGGNPARFILESQGNITTNVFGTLENEIVWDDNIESGDLRLYQFSTAPANQGWWLFLENPVGMPYIVVNAGPDIPDPAYQDSEKYGIEGGKSSGVVGAPTLIEAFTYVPELTFVVAARKYAGTYVDARYRLRIREIVPQPLPFDGGTTNLVEVPGDQGAFFYVTVPPEATGWDLRLTGEITGYPKLYLRKGSWLPDPNLNMSLAKQMTWPDRSEWAVNLDWTARRYSADGDDESGRVFAVGRGRPLVSGTYCVGVYGAGLMNFGLSSRGIGPGFSIPVTSLDFNTGTATATLAPREAAYFQVTIPANTASWKVRVTATNGEAMLVTLKDSLPNIGAEVLGSASATNSAGRKLQKLGDELFVLLPSPGQDYLAAGTYYLGVIGEGVTPASINYVGTNTSTVFVASLGAAPVRTINVTANADVFVTNSLAGEDIELYSLAIPANTLNFEAALEDVTGNPVMVMRAGARVPYPGIGSGLVGEDPYGSDGGENDLASLFLDPKLITVANPSTLSYMLAVKARSYTGATYRLRLSASDATTLDVDGAPASVANQPPGTWRFFRTRVPANVLGWDLRLTNVLGWGPRLVVRRDTLPSGTNTTTSWTPQAGTNWPANNQWAPDKDWTQRQFASDGVTDESGRVLAMGMGRPLEPGNYYIGVYNANPATPATYTLLNRGIGDGWSIPVTDLPFVGSVTNSQLPAREAAYFRLVIPSNAPSWQVALRTVGGESMLAISKMVLPNVKSIALSGTLATGKGMDQSGNEHFLLLPAPGATNLPVGTNYLVVVSEGVNPTATTIPKPAIGSGGSSYELTSFGPLALKDLGLLTSEDLAEPNVAADCGQVKAYRFDVPVGMAGCRVRLDSPEGNPMALVLQGNYLPNPGAGVAGTVADPYGNEGGYGVTNGHPTLVTLANPLPGPYTVLVKARANTDWRSAKFSLRIQELLEPEVNFAGEQNVNGISNIISAKLVENERAFFKVYVPDTLNNQPVIGWKLDLEPASGKAWMRVRRAPLLPSDADASLLMPFTPDFTIVAPPFLTDGWWFVEVKGSNSAAIKLTSSALTLQRPAWVMPPPGATNRLAGLPWHVFGSSTIAPDGTPLGDQGIDLAAGALHYYAVDVPETNSGLVRVQLDAVSYNPNLYMRRDFIPTLYHNTNGAAGTIYDRAMLATTNTEFANWVPLDGKKENRLQAGRYYLAVHAAANTARYRLYVSTGNLQDLPLHGPLQTNQFVNGGDWGYYRVHVPLGVPATFNVTFKSELPNSFFRVHLRDNIPPGNGATGADTIRDWTTDQKNSTTLQSYGTNGTFTFAVPPVRPGYDYYLGVRATTDSTFSLGVSTNGEAAVEPPALDFYSDSTQLLLAAHQQALYRIYAPPEATRLKFTATHSNTVVLFIEQGTLPSRTSSDDWTSGTLANSYLNKPLVGWNNATHNIDPGVWPWVADQYFYLLVTNTSSLMQDFSLTTAGVNQLIEDEDRDQLLDFWEDYYFGTITSQIATNDFDRDGVRNIEEQIDGTDPTSPYSYNCRLTILTTNGLVTAAPPMERYPQNSDAVLSAAPDSGYSFVGWSGDAAGLANPLVLRMNAPKIVFATFKLTGDEFISALPLTGAAINTTAMNVSMSKEPGEPFHAGNPGGKSIWWRWTAPSSGEVTLSTAGSAFNTLLAVYVGPTVSTLTPVASVRNPVGGTNQVKFTATAFTTYNIAVDGLDGASSRISLSLNLKAGDSNVLKIESLTALADGTVQIGLLGNPNQAYLLEASPDLADWQPITSLNTDSRGRALYTDPAAQYLTLRFYRARTP